MTVTMFLASAAYNLRAITGRLDHFGKQAQNQSVCVHVHMYAYTYLCVCMYVYMSMSNVYMHVCE